MKSGSCGGACGGCACGSGGSGTRAGLTVRRIEAKDVEQCQALLEAGMLENAEWSHLPLSRWCPIAGAALAGTAANLASRGASSRAVGGVLGAGFLMAAGCIALVVRLRIAIRQYVKECLADDMRDPVAFYGAAGSCFWVCEDAGGRLVGTVALERKSDTLAELRRMSVARSARGRGVARQLWRALLLFAREQGYEKIVLGTSNLMIDAVPMYKKWGFVLKREFGVGIGPLIKAQQYELAVAGARS